MNKQTTCFFTGHRELPQEKYDEIFQSVCNHIEALYHKGYTDFIAGGAIGFDTLCSLAVLKLSKTYDINLHIYVPCLGQEKYFSEDQKKQYSDILELAKSVTVLAPKYTRGCMHTRNRKMADDSSVCIAYCTKTTGGSAYTVDYAIKKSLEIIHIS